MHVVQFLFDLRCAVDLEPTSLELMQLFSEHAEQDSLGLIVIEQPSTVIA
jgi:hypothetical protein